MEILRTCSIGKNSISWNVITDGSTHCKYVKMAVQHKLPVICQKPMANTLADAEDMVRVSREAGVPFFIHENWRWQAQIRQFKKVLNRARLEFRSGLAFSWCRVIPCSAPRRV